jgi:beta-N-acetylhexosaminidase
LLRCVSSWPLRDRVALMVWPAVYSSTWNSALYTVRTTGVGGVVLMEPSTTFTQHLAVHISQLDTAARHGVLVSTDEEGGTVQRLEALGALPSQADMSTMPRDKVKQLIDAHAATVAATGIDVVLAPVVDVRPQHGISPIGNSRLFAGDAKTVGELGRIYVDAWMHAGVLPILKHYPGHGSATADTHQQLAITPPIGQLRTRDLVPYAMLADTGAGVMVGHLAVPGLTGTTPASLSPAAVHLLRTELGYGDSLVMTDSLAMGAVGLSVPRAAVRAIAAGVDVVIFTSTEQAGEVIDAIVRAVGDGTLTDATIDDSAARVARTMELHGGPCRPQQP